MSAAPSLHSKAFDKIFNSQVRDVYSLSSSLDGWMDG